MKLNTAFDVTLGQLLLLFIIVILLGFIIGILFQIETKLF
jgi:hypothetical protein